ncbi:ribonuclease-like 3, partial [Clarias magur]
MMEIRVFSLVLLLVLSAALPAEAQNWDAFLKKHINENMRAKDCNKVIKVMEINKPGNPCKSLNSIIKAKETEVKAVCNGTGKLVIGNRYESIESFNVITCISGTKNPCQYEGRESRLHIILA